MIPLLPYLIIFCAGAYFGRRRLRPRQTHSLWKLAEGAIVGFIAGRYSDGR